MQIFKTEKYIIKYSAYELYFWNNYPLKYFTKLLIGIYFVKFEVVLCINLYNTFAYVYSQYLIQNLWYCIFLSRSWWIKSVVYMFHTIILLRTLWIFVYRAYYLYMFHFFIIYVTFDTSYHFGTSVRLHLICFLQRLFLKKCRKTYSQLQFSTKINSEKRTKQRFI